MTERKYFYLQNCYTKLLGITNHTIGIATLFLFLFMNVLSYSQSKDSIRFSREIGLINNIKKYCSKKLQIDLPKDFYTKWALSDEPNFYLYASDIEQLSAKFVKNYGHDLKHVLKKKIFIG